MLTAQYWGKGDCRTIEKILGMAFRIAFLVALVFAAAAFCIPDMLMRIYSSEPDVIREGVKYLRIVGVSYLLMAFTQIYLNIMRSIEKVIIATIVYSISLLVNILINAVLIFGLFGMPKLGIVGAAIGTLMARVVEAAIVFWYAVVKNKMVKIHVKDLFQTDKLLMGDFLMYSLPVVLNELMWGLGSSANTAVIGHLGSAAVAANSVAQVARQLATVVAFGICNATAIYLGKTIGEQRFEDAKVYGRKFIKLSLIAGVIGGGLILIAAPVANAVMALTKEAQSYLTFMFFVMSYFTVAQALNTTLVVGVFRSGGDTKFGLALDVGIMSDEIIKLPITLKRCYGYKWIKDVTRDMSTLE